MSKIKLGDVTKIRTGKLDANASSENGKYPFFTCSKEPLRIDSYSYDCECVLVAGNGDLNVKYYKGKFDAYQRTYIIEDNSNGRLLIPYLYYFLELYVEELRKQSIGGVIKYIKLGNLTDAIIELPSIEKQKEVVNILNKSRKIVESKNVLLQSYDQLIKSRFVEMFGDRFTNDMGWDTKKLGEIVSFHNGKAHEQVVDVNGKYILVTSRAIASDFTDFRRTNEMLYPLHRNDIVMVMSDVPNGLALAKCQLIEEDNKYTLNQRICSFDNYSFNAIFLLNLLNRHQHFLSFNNQNSQTNLRKNDILDCKLIVPPAELQNQFSDFVEQIDKLKFEVQKSLDESKKLFDSLMQEYFG